MVKYAYIYLAHYLVRVVSVKMCTFSKWWGTQEAEAVGYWICGKPRIVHRGERTPQIKDI